MLSENFSEPVGFSATLFNFWLGLTLISFAHVLVYMIHKKKPSSSSSTAPSIKSPRLRENIFSKELSPSLESHGQSTTTTTTATNKNNGDDKSRIDQKNVGGDGQQSNEEKLIGKRTFGLFLVFVSCVRT
jgi:hypothetical protein